MLEFLNVLVLSGAQAETIVYGCVFLILAWFIGWVLRCPIPEAAAVGLIVLSGCAALSFIWSKALQLSSTSFGSLVIINIIWVSLLLRRTVFTERQPFEGNRNQFWLAVAIPISALLVVNLVQPDGSAGLASHQGWDPLYVDEVFAREKFFDPRETQFGNGYLVSISYLIDLIGLTSFGKWLGFTDTYAIYNAGATAASIAAVMILTYSFQRCVFAQVCYVLIFLILLRVDGVFRLFVGYNYSEAILYLGGAIICHIMGTRIDLKRAFMISSGISLFLVFSRHYGAFYSACITFAGLVYDRIKHSSPATSSWLILFGCLFVFTFQELLFLLAPPSDWYPAGKLLELKLSGSSATHKLIQSLNDLGFTYSGEWPKDLRALRSLSWVFVMLFVFRAIIMDGAQRRDALRALTPLIVLILPLILQVATGYRTTSEYNKLFVFGIFFHSWYIAYGVMICMSFQSTRMLLTRFREFKSWNRYVIPGGCSLAIITLMFLLHSKFNDHRLIKEGPTAYVRWAFQTYRETNADLNIARLIKARYGANIKFIESHPILYFHYEPGVSLRLYLKGKFFEDLDFWSPKVQALTTRVDSFSELLDALGRPNVYVSFSNGMVYSTFFDKTLLSKFSRELDEPIVSGWASDIVEYKDARFIVTKTK